MIVICGSLEDYLTLFLLIFGLMELFTFLRKTFFVEKVLEINLYIPIRLTVVGLEH